MALFFQLTNLCDVQPPEQIFARTRGGLLFAKGLWHSTSFVRFHLASMRSSAHKRLHAHHHIFMQCAGGLEDGATRCAQLLNMLHDLPREDQDPDDPAVFINTEIRNAFQEMCRQTSFDTLMGVATQTYDGGRVQPGDAIPTISELEPFLGYFWAMHSTECIITPIGLLTTVDALITSPPLPEASKVTG